jgi:hypothetical protein
LPLPIGVYSNHTAFAGAIRSETMGKLRQGNKEPKKLAVMTPKEKKAAKHAKKHTSDIAPLILR